MTAENSQRLATIEEAIADIRAGKMLINFVRLEVGGCGGLQNQCSHAREMTSFLKRDALVYAKR